MVQPTVCHTNASGSILSFLSISRTVAFANAWRFQWDEEPAHRFHIDLKHERVCEIHQVG
jgi:hypothetical protein